jgi:DNA uptake protein ComE-like DNA-binding protein
MEGDLLKSESVDFEYPQEEEVRHSPLNAMSGKPPLVPNNFALVDRLRTIPHVGTSLAKAIVAVRESSGNITREFYRQSVDTSSPLRCLVR